MSLTVKSKSTVTACEESQKTETAKIQDSKANINKQPKIMDADSAKKAAQKDFLEKTQKKIGGGCPACGAG